MVFFSPESEVNEMSENGIVLVCVTAQQSSRLLIECGKKLAEEKNAELRIFSVLPQRQSFSPDLDALVRLQEIADDAHAQMKVCFSDSPVDCVSQELLTKNVRMLVTGFPGKNSTKFITQLHANSPLTPMCMVDNDGTAYSIERVPRSAQEDYAAQSSHAYIHTAE